MKVATTKNISRPNDLVYMDMEMLHITVKDNRRYALHRSYNPLLDCYMVSDYATGYVLTCFAATPLREEDPTHRQAIAVFQATVDAIDSDKVRDALKGIPLVNTNGGS